MKFEVGETVIVRTYHRIPGNWNQDMMRFMGNTVTIHSNDHYDEDWPYRIEEDSRWIWRHRDFIPLLTDTKDPNYVFKHRSK